MDGISKEGLKQVLVALDDKFVDVAAVLGALLECLTDSGLLDMGKFDLAKAQWLCKLDQMNAEIRDGYLAGRDRDDLIREIVRRSTDAHG